MKLTISKNGYQSKPEEITIKWLQSTKLQEKTQPAWDLLECKNDCFNHVSDI